MGDKRLTLGNKVALLGEHFGLSQERLADLLGVSRSTIASYKNRDNASPDQARARAWAERFGIPFGWFLDGEDGPPPVPRDYADAERLARGGGEDARLTAIPPEDMTYDEEDFSSSETVQIPVWNGVVAGLDDCHFLEEKRPRRMHVPKFFFSRKNPERFILCLPKGVSMAPRIISPDRVISFLTPDPPPNAIVVARREDGVNFVKVLRVDRMGEKSLHSIHPQFPPIERLEGWTLRAAVVGIWKPYELTGPNIEFNGGMPLRG